MKFALAAVAFLAGNSEALIRSLSDVKGWTPSYKVNRLASTRGGTDYVRYAECQLHFANHFKYADLMFEKSFNGYYNLEWVWNAGSSSWDPADVDHWIYMSDLYPTMTGIWEPQYAVFLYNRKHYDAKRCLKTQTLSPEPRM